MERIAPLAKILAEANGIDWQHLQGSGDGGQIVEQDILTHLARIMSGEEEPPATPVDAPPPDWNGEEIPAGGGMFSADMLSAAGVDSDIAAFVEQTRPAAESAPTSVPVSAPAPVEPAPVQEEELEFELEEEDTPETAPSAPVIPMPAPVEPPATQTPPPAQGGAAAGLGSLLSRLYKSSPTEPPAAAAPEAASVPAAVSTPAPTPMPEAPPVRPAAQTSPVEAPRIETPSVQTPAARIEVPAVAPTPVTPAPAPAMAQPITVTPEPTSVPAAVAPPVPAAVQPAASAGQDAVWFGVYLRREAHMGAVAELRTQLSEALGQDLPLALLVARAAQRHAERLNLGSVALHDGARTRSVKGGHLRDTLGGLDTDHSGTPDLLIVDAGAHGLDDLHFPQTLTLSIGRVHDGRAALSLNGNVDTAQAAQFLADVAGTLERPIVLVL